MRSRAVLSVAFAAVAVAPVMSVPIAGSQLTQPTIESLPPNLNQTTQVTQTYGDIVDGFLSTLNTEQVQELSSILQAAMNGTQVAASSTPTMPTNSSTQHQPEKRQFGDLFGILFEGAAKAGAKVGKDVAESAVKSAVKRTPAPTPSVPIPTGVSSQDEGNHPEKRQLGDLFGILFEGAAKAGAKVGKDVAESAIKSAVKRTPAPTPSMPIPTSVSTQDELDHLEKRQLGDLFDILFEGAAKAGAKVGKDVAESAVKSAVKRTPAPTPDAKREGWTHPAIPTPPPVSACGRSRSCEPGADLDLD